MHLLGDIHQPLHCTAVYSVESVPKGDKGGNYILVKRGRNLHSLWDGLLGRDYFMRDVRKVAAELSDKQKYSAEWNDTLTVDPKQWADEGHELCRSAVYTDA